MAVVAFWTRNVGEAIGHIEELPLNLPIPVETTADRRVSASVALETEQRLKPGETYSTPRTFVAVYSGDHFVPLSQWSKAFGARRTQPANKQQRGLRRELVQLGI